MQERPAIPVTVIEIICSYLFLKGVGRLAPPSLIGETYQKEIYQSFNPFYCNAIRCFCSRR